MDGRWFSEAGRAEMLQQQMNMGTNAQAVVRGMGSEIEAGIKLGAHLAGAENPSAITEKIVDWVDAGGIITTAGNSGGLLNKIITTLGSRPIMEALFSNVIKKMHMH